MTSKFIARRRRLTPALLLVCLLFQLAGGQCGCDDHFYWFAESNSEIRAHQQSVHRNCRAHCGNVGHSKFWQHDGSQHDGSRHDHLGRDQSLGPSQRSGHHHHGCDPTSPLVSVPHDHGCVGTTTLLFVNNSKPSVLRFTSIGHDLPPAVHAGLHRDSLLDSFRRVPLQIVTRDVQATLQVFLI